MERLTMLKDFPLFSSLNEQELGKIAAGITTKTYTHGAPICQRGAPGGSLYLIKKGKVSVTLPLYRYEKKQHIVSILSEGNFFGELSFFDGRPCSGDVHANGEVTLLELKKADYDKIIDSDPEAGYDIQHKIILTLVRTIKKMNDKYSFNAFPR